MWNKSNTIVKLKNNCYHDSQVIYVLKNYHFKYNNLRISRHILIQHNDKTINKRVTPKCSNDKRP